MFLKVREKKISLKLRSYNKLEARYYGPFDILSKIGHIEYEITLPLNIIYYNVFHVSLLMKYVHDPNHVIGWHLIWVELEGDFQVQLVHILDRKVTVFKNRAIGKVKVQWMHYILEDATWEMEDVM